MDCINYCMNFLTEVIFFPLRFFSEAFLYLRLQNGLEKTPSYPWRVFIVPFILENRLANVLALFSEAYFLALSLFTPARFSVDWWYISALHGWWSLVGIWEMRGDDEKIINIQFSIFNIQITSEKPLWQIVGSQLRIEYWLLRIFLKKSCKLISRILFHSQCEHNYHLSGRDIAAAIYLPTHQLRRATLRHWHIWHFST